MNSKNTRFLLLALGLASTAGLLTSIWVGAIVLFALLAILGSRLLLDNDKRGVFYLFPSACALTIFTLFLVPEQRNFYGTAVVIFNTMVGARLMNSAFPKSRGLMSILAFGTVLVLPFEGVSLALVDLELAPVGVKLLPVCSLALVISFYIQSNKKVFSTKEELDTSEKENLYMQQIMRLVSHNIRTPLANVVLLTETAKFLYQDPQLASLLDRIALSVQHSSEFMNRLLRVLNESELAEEYSLDDILVHFKKRNPTLSIEVLPKSTSQYSQVEYVALLLSLEVFIDNAYRHGQEPVSMTIDAATIQIRDSGLGMTPTELAGFGKKQPNGDAVVHGVGMNFAIEMLHQLAFKVSAANISSGFQVSLNRT